MECINFASALAESYELWLFRHSQTYYSNDNKRYARLLQLLEDVILFNEHEQFVSEYFKTK